MKQTINQLRTSLVVAIIRAKDGAIVRKTVDALAEGGVRSIEVTMNTPGALDHIRRVSSAVGADITIGAGTVTSVEQVMQSVDAGARFIVTPFSKKDIIETAHQLNVPIIPGAFTPREIAEAHEWGADVVKLFPAEFFGPAYLRSVRAPLDTIPIMPTGGITAENALQWLEAGAVMLGVGSALFSEKLALAGDFNAIRKKAEEFMKVVGKRNQ